MASTSPFPRAAGKSLARASTIAMVAIVVAVIALIVLLVVFFLQR